VGVIFSVGQTDITHFYAIVSVCAMLSAQRRSGIG